MNIVSTIIISHKSEFLSVDVESGRITVIMVAFSLPLECHLVLPVARPSLLGALLPLIRSQLSFLRSQLTLLCLLLLLLLSHGLVVFEGFEKFVPLAMVGDVFGTVQVATEILVLIVW